MINDPLLFMWHAIIINMIYPLFYHSHTPRMVTFHLHRCPSWSKGCGSSPPIERCEGSNPSLCKFFFFLFLSFCLSVPFFVPLVGYVVYTYIQSKRMKIYRSYIDVCISTGSYVEAWNDTPGCVTSDDGIISSLVGMTRIISSDGQHTMKQQHESKSYHAMAEIESISRASSITLIISS